MVVGFAATAAYAADLSITGNLSQTLTGSDNFFLNNKPSGPTYESITALRLNFLARTPVTDYHFDTHFSYYSYFGEGASDTTQQNGTPMGGHFYVDHRSDPLTRWNFGASWERVDVASTQLAESGLATGRGYSDTYTAHGSVTRDLTKLDTVTLSAVASTASFSASGSGQTPYDDYNTTLQWTHRISPLLSWNNSVYFDFFANDDAFGSQRVVGRANSGLEATLSPRLRAHASFGWIFGNSYVTTGVVAAPVTSSLFSYGAGNSPLWDVGLNYQFTKTLSGALSFNQAVTPTLTGQLQKSTAVQGGLSQQINSYSTVSLTSQYSHLIGGLTSGASDVFTAGLGYTYNFTRQLRGTASYTFTTRQDETGNARANIFLLSLSKDFTALP
jgi:hypothetical protein